MRSDIIVAQQAQRRAGHGAAEPDALGPRQPSVRSVVQRVSSAEPEASKNIRARYVVTGPEHSVTSFTMRQHHRA